MRLSSIKRIIQTIEDAGVDIEKEFFVADHDVLYIPVHERESKLAKRLQKLGCHWDENSDSWAVF